jgi:hypothetical protein
VNLAERYFYAFNQDHNVLELHLVPWLYVPKEQGPDGYILVTKGYGMPSRAAHNDAIKMFVDRGLVENSVFVGLQSECDNFRKTYNCELPFVKVEDALDMAQWIANSSMVLGNQTSTTAIAESMKKTMFLEKRIDGGQYDCQFMRPNLFYI